MKSTEKGVITIYETFKAEIAKVKRLRGLTNADIGELAGYAKKTIDMFMAVAESKGRTDSAKVAQAIAQALDIPLDIPQKNDEKEAG